MLFLCLFTSAVQSERKPFDIQREKPSNCAASTEKIYIRKDLRSPHIATPTFVTDKEGGRWVSYTVCFSVWGCLDTCMIHAAVFATVCFYIYVMMCPAYCCHHLWPAASIVTLPWQVLMGCQVTRWPQWKEESIQSIHFFCMWIVSVVEFVLKVHSVFCPCIDASLLQTSRTSRSRDVGEYPAASNTWWWHHGPVCRFQGQVNLLRVDKSLVSIIVRRL